MPSDSNLPARQPLNRTALERVLARAAELQAGTGEPSDELTDEQIVELGKEVGLSSENLRLALAEERTRLAMRPESSGLGARLYGEASLSASRTVNGAPREVLALLDAWMQREECLQVKRQFDERIVWEAQRGLVSTARRVLNVHGRSYALSQAHEVAATVVPLESNRVLVRLDADFSNTRSDVTRGTVGLSALGAASSGAVVVVGRAVPLAVPAALVVGAAVAPIVVLSGIGYWAAKSMLGRQLSRAQLALEQLLDRLARGDLAKQPSLLSVLAAAASQLPRNRY
jgi:hypothetical protein